MLATCWFSFEFDVYVFYLIFPLVQVVETALALQDAGCFAVVLECVPGPVAAAATSALRIPTIGIGAGSFCSGQVCWQPFPILLIHVNLEMCIFSWNN